MSHFEDAHRDQCHRVRPAAVLYAWIGLLACMAAAGGVVYVILRVF